MDCKKIPFSGTHAFSPFFQNYIYENEPLKSFYHRFPRIENFNDQIVEKAKSFTLEKRKVLVQTLSDQYKNYNQSDVVKNNTLNGRQMDLLV